MALRAFFLYLAASHGTGGLNNRDPEIGLEIIQEDTLDEVPSNDRNNDGEELNDDDTNFVEGDAADGSDKRPRLRRFSSAFSRSFTLVEQPTWFQKVKSFVFPPKEDIDSFVPHYRHTPMISGFLIPFSILLEIPGLTEHWYIRTQDNQVVEHRSNPVLLNVGLGLSLACAILANLCLITRFLEIRVKTMTLLCVAFLSIHGTPYSICHMLVYRLDDRYY
jgi:potassium channel subfamily K, other eukaryote